IEQIGNDSARVVKTVVLFIFHVESSLAPDDVTSKTNLSDSYTNGLLSSLRSLDRTHSLAIGRWRVQPKGKARGVSGNRLIFTVPDLARFLGKRRHIHKSSTVIWNPTAIGLVNKLESVRREFTRRIFWRSHLPHSSYPQRLEHFKLETLEYRRALNDMHFLFDSVHRFVHLDTSNLYSIAPLCCQYFPFRDEPADESNVPHITFENLESKTYRESIFFAVPKLKKHNMRPFAIESGRDPEGFGTAQKCRFSENEHDDRDSTCETALVLLTLVTILFYFSIFFEVYKLEEEKRRSIIELIDNSVLVVASMIAIVFCATIIMHE
ncbi:hypothetical protein PRIPAC_92645, partial [Pristionchus pacificus]|uniref:Uncharacterized protein n=1 Tax=Pristionchus pacificus TaxID=54126 RepID=A0A2A6CHW8_PRIPA